MTIKKRMKGTKQKRKEKKRKGKKKKNYIRHEPYTTRSFTTPHLSIKKGGVASAKTGDQLWPPKRVLPPRA